MLPSFLVLALSMLYLNHSCITKSLPSVSSENNGLVANSLSLSQNGEYEKDNHFCLTPDCVKAAASLINRMDKSVDPCDDFYQFACGNYIKNTILKDDEMLESSFNEITRTTQNSLEMIVTEPIQPDELRPFKMMKLLFKSCMDQEQIERVGLETFKEILKSLGGWPVLEADKWNESMFTWMESMYKIRESKSFMKISITTDMYNNTNQYLVVDSASLGIEQTYLAKGIHDKNVDIYYRYMVDIAVLFGADRQRAIKEMGESLEFEIELAKIAMSSEEGNDITNHHRMKLADLQQKIPSIPWQDYLNKYYNIQQEDMIGVISLKYLIGLETLLNKTPKRVQANYVIRRFVIDSVIFLTEELRDRKQKYEKEMNPSAVIVSRKTMCVAVSQYCFRVAMASMYVRRFLNYNVKQMILEILKVFMEEMYKIISSNKWMDDETRKNAIAKLKSMKYIIAYPDELFDDSILDAYYKNLEVNDQDFYTAVLNVTKFNMDSTVSKLVKPFNKSNWNNHIDQLLEVNAMYNILQNLLIIPAAVLQGAVFSEDRPQYMIHGTFGSVISHEINHGFDSNGKMFDHNGNMVDWWEEETKKRFAEKEQCFIRQYDNYTFTSGSKLDGNKTLSENMSDNGGMKLTYNAYREWVKRHGVEPRLPGLQEYTPQQLFWLSSANMWCTKHNKYNLEDTHSPANIRIMGTFSNMEDFSNDFRCPLGSNMNPVKKCEMW